MALRVLAFIGAAVRRRTAFILQLAALFWGVLREGMWPITWRRTLRRRFRVILTRTVGGSLGTTAVTAIIVGVGLVFELLYWLRAAGQQEQVGRILVLVLFREITPLLVGVILLGRGGTVAVAELSALKAEGEIDVLRAEGVDIFQYILLPRAFAFAMAGFTLGMLFVVVALTSGYIVGSASGVATRSLFGFLDNVLRALTAADVVIFPGKLVLIGLMVALVCCITGIAATDTDVPATLLPQGFTRGVTTILAVTLALSAMI